MTHAGVNVFEEKLVKAVIEPLPHVGVFVNAANAAGYFRHVDVVKLSERYRNSVMNDILVVEELTEAVSDSKEC